MSLLDVLRKPDMLEEVNNCRDERGYLIDVRSKDEYAGGRIPGSINIPVNEIKSIEKTIKNKDSLICLYCQSGVRASSAKTALTAMGYTNVKNLGGIKRYKGKIER